MYSAELKSSGQFKEITKHIVENWKDWQEWMNSEDPYKLPIPGAPAGSEVGCYQEQLSMFDRLILMKTFRPELIQQSISTYIINEIGNFYAESPSVSMKLIFEDIDKTIPLIFVLSQGADPTSQLLKFAKEMDFESKLTAISLGQGQDTIAT